jgi:hypothetical protein
MNSKLLLSFLILIVQFLYFYGFNEDRAIAEKNIQLIRYNLHLMHSEGRHQVN